MTDQLFNSQQTIWIEQEYANMIWLEEYKTCTIHNETWRRSLNAPACSEYSHKNTANEFYTCIQNIVICNIQEAMKKRYAFNQFSFGQNYCEIADTNTKLSLLCNNVECSQTGEYN